MATPFKPLCNKSRHNTYGICRIITDELIMEFNWDGLQNKDALKDFNNVNRYLCGKFIVMRSGLKDPFSLNLLRFGMTSLL